MKFAQLIADELDALDDYINQSLHSDVALVGQVASYLVEAGGKRIRPTLLILMARALGYTGSHVISQGAVVEFIHTATLLHDDVVDESMLRRGRQTTNQVFGNAASVLVGDFIYSRSFQLMLEVEDIRILRILADVTNQIAEGEVLQLMNIGDPEVSEQRYYQVIESKTAALFVASCEIAALLAGRVDLQADVAEFGRALGVAFQLIDDVLDYQADEQIMGKCVGDDLAEGKPTLPLLRAAAKADDTMRVQIERAIAEPGAVDPAPIIQWVIDSGAIEETRQAALLQVDRAAAALSAVPDGDYKLALLELARSAVDRIK
ncbi:MAG: polyprenyl synthetase family protein [Gammaproteobacteria bacterium]|nr:polyprenyl synthetase family protein [Gammaproteobacteria bacterium]